MFRLIPVLVFDVSGLRYGHQRDLEGSDCGKKGVHSIDEGLSLDRSSLLELAK
jgi:hypothetical protein